jgi:ACT domain-containing protein
MPNSQQQFFISIEQISGLISAIISALASRETEMNVFRISKDRMITLTRTITISALY